METNEQIPAELNELFTALAKAQNEMDIAAKDKKNHQSSYADLKEVVSASRPALTNNGLAVTQLLRLQPEGRTSLKSVLGHSSGQHIYSEMWLAPIKGDPQSMGSAITYARRYSYAGLVGVLTGDDDDGHKASDKIEMVHPQDAKAIETRLKNEPEINTLLLKTFGVQSWYKLPYDQYDLVMNTIDKSM